MQGQDDPASEDDDGDCKVHSWTSDEDASSEECKPLGTKDTQDNVAAVQGRLRVSKPPPCAIRVQRVPAQMTLSSLQQSIDNQTCMLCIIIRCQGSPKQCSSCSKKPQSEHGCCMAQCLTSCRNSAPAVMMSALLLLSLAPNRGFQETAFSTLW